MDALEFFTDSNEEGKVFVPVGIIDEVWDLVIVLVLLVQVDIDVDLDLIKQID